jgi:hypothetical protein
MLMFYHLGEAVKAAAVGEKHFYEHVQDNYDTCKRGTERRHFRGAAGRASIASIIQAFPASPAAAVRSLHAPLYPTLRANYANRLAGFGDYFIWKAADFTDRIFDLPIDYSQALKFMPNEPIKCAKTVWPDQPVQQTLDMVVEEIKQYPAPPGRDRPCGVSEAETVLCMLKGYFITKTHVIGDDINDKHDDLGDDLYDLAKYLPPKVILTDWTRGELVR